VNSVQSWTVSGCASRNAPLPLQPSNLLTEDSAVMNRIARLLAACLATLASLVPAPAMAVLPAVVEGAPMPSLAPMLDRATPGVVNIATEGRVRIQRNPLLEDPFFRRFFNIPDQPAERKTEALGSGVIVDAARGLVVTNNHVIANADQIRVKLRDGRVLAAELVGTDPETDVAVIRIPAEGLAALPMADSAGLRVGDFVVAIGNPFGLGQTVTSGIVSALGRSGLGILGYEDLIQTDASINPGNSGGALVNLRGELVGINTAIFSQSGGNIGIGFAIPVNMVQQVMEQLVQFGEVKRGFLGAQLQDLDPELAEAFGLKDQSGAVLNAIVPGSAADKAGLKAGDVVVSLNGRSINSAADLRNQIGLLRVGDKVDLSILRDGKTLRKEATVSPREVAEVAGSELQNERLNGATFRNHEAPSGERGVTVTEVIPGTRAWQSGLRAGDVVTQVNRVVIADVDDLAKVINAVRGQIVLRVRRQDVEAFMMMR
jgi:Do/DeqQ family serine protease